MLVNGNWSTDWQPIQGKDKQGRFIRQTSSFRNWVTADGSPGITGQGGFKAEKNRYHLYVAYICPWASRTLMALQLKGLTDVISTSAVDPRLGAQGWQFGHYPGADKDTLNGAQFIHQLYSQADAGYTGRATVPVLWDKQRQTIVNNESADILRMLNTAFSEFTESTLDLYPAEIATEIDLLNERIYNELNNGVYQAGFASSQAAYAEAYGKVFGMLDELEERLADNRPYLFGNRLTETDVRLFVTLIRFDSAYHGLFKCNRNLLRSMTRLWAYTQRILALEGIKKTVNMDHIKTGYYSIRALNPSGIVPLGPELN